MIVNASVMYCCEILNSKWSTNKMRNMIICIILFSINHISGGANCPTTGSISGSGNITLSYNITGGAGGSISCAANYSFTFVNSYTGSRYVTYTVSCEGVSITESPTIGGCSNGISGRLNGNGTIYSYSNFPGGPYTVAASISGSGGLSASDSKVAH